MRPDRPKGIRKEYVSDLYQCKEKVPAPVEKLLARAKTRLFFFGDTLSVLRPAMGHPVAHPSGVRSFTLHQRFSPHSLFSANLCVLCVGVYPDPVGG